MGRQEATETGGRVLIVDDDRGSLELLAVALLESGFTIRTADSAREALLEARRLPPSLILLDVMMPEIDGFQLCATLKEDPRLSGIPVVLISATGADRHFRERSSSVGAADYLTKPVDLPSLVHTVRRLAA